MKLLRKIGILFLFATSITMLFMGSTIMTGNTSIGGCQQTYYSKDFSHTFQYSESYTIDLQWARQSTTCNVVDGAVTFTSITNTGNGGLPDAECASTGCPTSWTANYQGTTLTVETFVQYNLVQASGSVSGTTTDKMTITVDSSGNTLSQTFSSSCCVN